MQTEWPPKACPNTSRCDIALSLSSGFRKDCFTRVSWGVPTKNPVHLIVQRLTSLGKAGALGQHTRFLESGKICAWESYTDLERCAGRLMLLPRSGTIAHLPIARAQHHGHPSSRLSLPQGFASSPRCGGCREPRPATTSRSFEPIRQTPEVATTRSRLLGVVVEVLAELALRAGHCAARHGHQMAQDGISVVLALKIETREAWTPARRT